VEWAPPIVAFIFFLLHSSFVHTTSAISSYPAGLVPRERLPRLELKQIDSSASVAVDSFDVCGETRPPWRRCVDSVSVVELPLTHLRRRSGSTSPSRTRVAARSSSCKRAHGDNVIQGGAVELPTRARGGG
jgi:hypothetical protein